MTGIFLVAVLARGDAPMGMTMLAGLIPALIGGAPLALVVWRLTRGPDAIGLAVGIAYPVMVIAVLLMEARAMWAGGTEQQMDLFARIVFFFADPVWGVFVAGLLPCLVLMGARSMRAVARGTMGSPWTALGGASLALVVGYAVVWRPITGYASLDPKGLEHLNVRSLASGGPPRPGLQGFSPGQALDLTEDIFACLFPAKDPRPEPRFPATLDGIAATDAITRESNCTTLVAKIRNDPGRYRVTYVPGPLDVDGRTRTFRLTVRENNVGRWGLRSEEWETSETAVTRQTIFDWRGQVIESESGAAFVDGLETILFIERMIATPFGGDSSRTLPERLRPSESPDTLPGDLVLDWPSRSCGASNDSAFAAVGASCFHLWDRPYIYELVRDSAGVVVGWALDAPAPMIRDYTPEDIGEYRSYWRDPSGTLHGRGPWSLAGPEDPLVTPHELKAARGGVDRIWAMKVGDWKRGLH